ncbi:MAG: hypothetical protein H7A37_06750 [Chlamydiales bacterium]|nr:hypothetical protein [Chlamydiales bacterium]
MMYLDAPNEDFTAYHQIASEQNRLLLEHFGSLYDTLKKNDYRLYRKVCGAIA